MNLSEVTRKDLMNGAAILLGAVIAVCLLLLLIFVVGPHLVTELDEADASNDHTLYCRGFAEGWGTAVVLLSARTENPAPLPTEQWLERQIADCLDGQFDSILRG